MSGFHGGTAVKNYLANAGDTGLIPGSGRSPGGGQGNTPVFLPGESRGQRSLVGYSPWDHKELDTTEQLTLLLILSEISQTEKDKYCSISLTGRVL